MSAKFETDTRIRKAELEAHHQRHSPGAPNCLTARNKTDFLKSFKAGSESAFKRFWTITGP
jgi:hypothetical protein